MKNTNDQFLIKTALLSWIENHKEDEKDNPYVTRRFDGGAKTYTLNELYKEIEDNTEFGQTSLLGIVYLTIDLLMRGKEKMKIEKLRTPLLDFSFEMEKKLRKNDYKGGWENEKNSFLTQRIKDEFQELLEAKNDKDIQAECVDIANFCMMLYDNIKKQENK